MAIAIQSLDSLFVHLSLVDPQITVARYALDSRDLPLAQDALPFAEQMRRALIRSRVDTSHSRALLGKTADGTPLGRARCMRITSRRMKTVMVGSDHVTMYAPCGFDLDDVRQRLAG